jgi:hypothetical protein
MGARHRGDADDLGRPPRNRELFVRRGARD